jgi:hypothetical protein
MNREVASYDAEVRQEDRIALDNAVVKALGFTESEVPKVVKIIHDAFLDAAEDRLTKIGDLRAAKRA